MESNDDNNQIHELNINNQNYGSEEQNELEQLERMRRQQFGNKFNYYIPQYH